MNWMMQNSIRTILLGVAHNLFNKKFSTVVVIEIILITFLLSLILLGILFKAKEKSIREEYEKPHIVPLMTEPAKEYEVFYL